MGGGMNRNWFRNPIGSDSLCCRWVFRFVVLSMGRNRRPHWFRLNADNSDVPIGRHQLGEGCGQ